jgi:CIC family chloride channel protein
MPSGQRIALIAAGAGAGIASTFNTLIGGVMFAIELMMPEVSVATFLPVAIATRDRNIRGSLVLWRYASLSRTVRCYQSLGVR